MAFMRHHLAVAGLTVQHWLTPSAYIICYMPHRDQPSEPAYKMTEVLPPDSAMMPLHAAARAAGLSEATMRRLVRDGLVEAVREGRTLQITQATVLELKAGGGLKRGPSVSMREAERARGELASMCFARFREGKPLIEIVEELQATPAAVKILWNEWRDLQESERRAVRLECLHNGHADGCDGPPQPHIGLCSRHAAQSRILTAEQKAILRGQNIPDASKCTACSEFALECICTACLALYIVITIEGEPSDRRIVVRVRDQIIASEPAIGIINQLGLIPRNKPGRPPKKPLPTVMTIEAALGLSPDLPTADEITSLVNEAKRTLQK